MTETEKYELNARLSILVRQARGVQAMIDTSRPEREIMAQISSLSGGIAALRRVAVIVILGRPLPENDPLERRNEERFREAVAKYLD